MKLIFLTEIQRQKLIEAKQLIEEVKQEINIDVEEFVIINTTHECLNRAINYKNIM